MCVEYFFLLPHPPPSISAFSALVDAADWHLYILCVNPGGNAPENCASTFWGALLACFALIKMIFPQHANVVVFLYIFC